MGKTLGTKLGEEMSTISKLERMRQLLNEQNKKVDTKPRVFENNGLYPFWNIDEGARCVIRFLPDGDTSNEDTFWKESKNIKLTFKGIKGVNNTPFELKVPCVEMWGEPCPILGYIRAEKWFNDPDMKALGSKYWKKSTWIMQGFVPENPLVEENPPANPIRRFSIGRQLFEIIRSGIVDPDLEASPDDFDNGYDFYLKKMIKPGTKHGDYTTSKWAARSRSLSAQEREAIDTYGLTDLREFLPKKPTAKQTEMLFDMFKASLEEDLYDANKWGDLPWRPRGLDNNVVPKQDASTDDSDNDKPVTRKAVTQPVEEKKTVASTDAAAPAASARVEDILAKIRSQKK